MVGHGWAGSASGFTITADTASRAREDGGKCGDISVTKAAAAVIALSPMPSPHLMALVTV